MTPISIVGVGDLMVGDSAISVGYGFASRYDDTGILRVAERVHPLLAGADVVFGNLECPLSDDGYVADDWRSAQMRGRPSYAEALRQAGFTVLSVANNHADQHGVAAFEKTVALIERAGIRACGLRGDDGWCTRPVRLGVHGQLVGVLAYSLRPRQYSRDAPPYAEGSEPEILADVARLRQEAPHVVVSLHWGEEYGGQPAADEVRLGRAIVDGGASVVVGHHPHVVRAVERYGNGVIAYSLGNFIADMVWLPQFRETVVLRCTLGAGVTSVELTSAFIDNGFVPGAARGKKAMRVADSLEGLDEQAYRRQTADTVRLQRAHAYLYAVRNVGRYHPRVLVQLFGTTLRNKWRSLTGEAG